MHIATPPRRIRDCLGINCKDTSKALAEEVELKAVATAKLQDRRVPA